MIIDAPKNEQISMLWTLWAEAFGDTDDFLSAFENTAFSTDRCRCVTVDGEVVAALYWFDCSYRNLKIAYLYAIATKKSHQGRGLCRALMENTHLHLKLLGYKGAILVPGSKELFDFYKKLGYQVCSRIGEFSCSAAENNIDIRRIDENEFAEIRRCYLPDGGVIQENENLKFLKTMADFYTGNGFLLASRREGDALYGMELLGDLTVAPAIVRSLGCIKGKFRTTGTDKEFTMYYPFENSKLTPPCYFGLAFD